MNELDRGTKTETHDLFDWIDMSKFAEFDQKIRAIIPESSIDSARFNVGYNWDNEKILEIVWDRPETDEEWNERLERIKKADEHVKKAKKSKEDQEWATYLRLQKKYGK